MSDQTYYVVTNAGGLYLSDVNRWAHEPEAALEFGTADGALKAAGGGHGVSVRKCKREEPPQPWRHQVYTDFTQADINAAALAGSDALEKAIRGLGYHECTGYTSQNVRDRYTIIAAFVGRARLLACCKAAIHDEGGVQARGLETRLSDAINMVERGLI